MVQTDWRSEMLIEILTLIENDQGEHLGLQSEHGLSFLIKIDKHQILFDTGQSSKFINNAAILNVDLRKTTQVVLSHGHYDHTGGFRDLVQTIGNSFGLHVKPEIFEPKYAYNNGSLQFLGNNFDKQFLKDKNIQTNYVKDDIVEIAPGIYVVSNFERLTDFEPVNQRFCRYSGLEYKIDLFEDEVVVVIDHPKGLIVLLGCSHPGLANILNTIVKRFNKKVYAILGGTHLVEANENRMEQTFDLLRKLNPTLLGISHCTGEKAVCRLNQFQNQFFLNSTGTSLRVE